MPPGSRLAARQPCAAAAEAATPTRIPTTVRMNLLAAIEPFHHVFLHAEALTAGGELPGAHFGGIGRNGVADRLARLGIALDEGRPEAGEEAHHVVEHQDLAVAVRAGAEDRKSTR